MLSLSSPPPPSSRHRCGAPTTFANPCHEGLLPLCEAYLLSHPIRRPLPTISKRQSMMVRYDYRYRDAAIKLLLNTQQDPSVEGQTIQATTWIIKPPSRPFTTWEKLTDPESNLKTIINQANRLITGWQQRAIIMIRPHNGDNTIVVGDGR